MLSIISTYFSTLFSAMSTIAFTSCILIVPFLLFLPFCLVCLFKLIWSAIWNMF